MAIYLDTMGHMAADTEAELHAFAARIGLKRTWFQDKPSGAHYDVTGGRRHAAIRAGAVEVSWRDMPGKVKAMARSHGD